MGKERKRRKGKEKRENRKIDKLGKEIERKRERGKTQNTDKEGKTGEKFKRGKWKEGETIRYLCKEFKIANVVVFGKHKKQVVVVANVMINYT